MLNALHQSKLSGKDWQRQSDRRIILQWSCASPPAFVFRAGSASGRLPCYRTAQSLYHMGPIETSGFQKRDIPVEGGSYWEGDGKIFACNWKEGGGGFRLLLAPCPSSRCPGAADRARLDAGGRALGSIPLQAGRWPSVLLVLVLVILSARNK